MRNIRKENQFGMGRCWVGLFPLHDAGYSFKGKQNSQRSQLDAILGSITDD